MSVDWDVVIPAASGLGGSLVGGAVVIVASFIQARQQAVRDAGRFNHEARLAAETFAREKADFENQRITAEIYEQLRWGSKIGVAVGRATHRYSKVNSTEERTKVLEALIAETEIGGPGGYSPFLDMIDVDLLEDGDLQGWVRQHRTKIEDAHSSLVLFSDREPTRLPDAVPLIAEVGALRKLIELRMRELKRNGRPL